MPADSLDDVPAAEREICIALARKLADHRGVMDAASHHDFLGLYALAVYEGRCSARREVEPALQYARAFFEDLAGETAVYGFFPGGDYDPRMFSPDRELCTSEEVAAWEAACAAWGRGERPEVKPSGRVEDVTLDGVTGPAVLCGSSFGLGTYRVAADPDVVAALKAIDAFLLAGGASSPGEKSAP